MDSLQTIQSATGTQALTPSQHNQILHQLSDRFRPLAAAGLGIVVVVACIGLVLMTISPLITIGVALACIVGCLMVLRVALEAGGHVEPWLLQRAYHRRAEQLTAEVSVSTLR